MALAFLPTAELSSSLTKLLEDIASNEALVKFHEYFVRTWVSGNFPPSVWNQYDVLSRHRTNIAVEGWHSRLNRLVRTTHPNLYVLVNHIKREQNHTESTIMDLELGRANIKSRKKFEQLNKKLESWHNEHVTGSLTSAMLLRRVVHVMHNFSET
jgi:hypothetical protein